MFGRPTPTKQTCWPSSARAAATIIISDLLKAGVGHGTCSIDGVDGLAEPPRGGDHPVGALRRAADPQAGVAAREEPLGDRVEDRGVRIAGVAPSAIGLLDERQREPLAHAPAGGRVGRAPATTRVIASTLAAIRCRVAVGARIDTGRRRGSSARRSSVRPVVDRAGRRGLATAAATAMPLRAELLDVGGPSVEVVDPLAQPGLDRVLVAGDRVPVEVEPVVAVVGALDVRGMRAPRLDDDGIDDEPRDDRPVRVGPDDRPRRRAPRPRR